ncbi:LysE family translocator [Corynebacterium pseudodiphtheriticum]|uniref:LysE family translocator n=1 Tax=Corynebacterium pseudodiphtheriticum TaxID=37637 RepID=A0ABT7FWT4_9CORY|nr:LysE family translocator [Corynebacterium pseudodiphtheriticum]ERJ42986.1 lysine transporter LysE [Corynebacterium pseudodiphtheriticum 090104]MCG7252798.1 LysE family translocator [Corynebacterium pseudodiphtheriticum]MDC7068687.1 LysE family translocator [Corynebacterium pseudodiphtheriticum]MDC7084753.1 LysE family translocator [Corynebacterium pseudodiphtheriticum]MDC7086804.1 LysE family translocator [Corynebacterium pseudodiphtheriticum]
MTLAQWVSLLALNLAGAASPGPDMILIMRLATRSRTHALAAALGIQLGVVMWTSLTVFGAAAILTAYPSVLAFVQLIGGIALIWMGRNMAMAGWRDRSTKPVDLADAALRLGSLKSAFKTGWLTNIANPKIVLFLAAIVAPLLPQSPSIGLSIAVIAALTLSAFLLFVVVAFFLSTKAVRRRVLAAGPWIDIASGVLFMVIGGSLAINGLATMIWA